MKRPLVAIVGRANVGKSTLFNRIVGRRQAIVLDQPGVTRDRHYAEVEWWGRRFTLVDTGGLDPSAESGLIGQVKRQTQRAIEEADAIVVLFDGREGLSALDRAVAEPMRRLEKPVFYVANKIDGPRDEPNAAEFYELGVEPILTISAEQGIGVDELIEGILAGFPKDASDGPAPVLEIPSVAVVGRPNVGKSTLINHLFGDERMVAESTPGTTRDAIDSILSRNGRQYRLIDTAGIRRRGRIEPGVERYGLSRALLAIKRADVAAVLIDAKEGIVEQDTKVLGEVLKSAKACLIFVNKWDLVATRPRETERITVELRRRLAFLPFAPIRFISAATGFDVKEFFDQVDEAYREYSRRVPTSQLNRVFQEALASHSPPQMAHRPVKFYYATQASTRPPTFVLFANRPDGVKAPYLRYLENFFRDRFGFAGTPIRFQLRARRSERRPPPSPKTSSRRSTGASPPSRRGKRRPPPKPKSPSRRSAGGPRSARGRQGGSQGPKRSRGRR